MGTFFSAWHFDGVSAVRRTVEIETIGSSFTLLEADRRYGPFSFADLHFVNQQGTAQVYGLNGRDGWRLGLEGQIPAELSLTLPKPEKYGRWVDRIGLGPASIGFALISAAVVAVVLLSPQWLAPLVPASVAKRSPSGSRAAEKPCRSSSSVMPSRWRETRWAKGMGK